MADFAKRHNLTRKETQTSGFATFLIYEGTSYSVEFICGPPEYHVEILVELKKTNQKYDLAALMAIPSITEWVINHKKMPDEDMILSETKRYVELLDFALPKLTDGQSRHDSIK
jgi:hypothetical protein